MNHNLRMLLVGGAVGYYLGSRPSAQARREVSTGLQWATARAGQGLATVRGLRSRQSAMNSSDEIFVATRDTSAPVMRVRDEEWFDAQADRLLDEVGRESFPSSDPPSSWAGHDRTFP